MNTEFVQSLIIGILVTLALYLTLSKSFDINISYRRKTLGLFSGAVGLLTTLWLFENRNMLEEYVAKIVIAGIAVVLALLAIAKKSIK